MSSIRSATVSPAWTLSTFLKKPKTRVWISIVAGVLTLGALAFWYSWPRLGKHLAAASLKGREKIPHANQGRPHGSSAVQLSEEQQHSIGLRTERVVYGASPRVSTAPGRVAPNENQYAFITPRAAGVVRSVTAHVGQEVKAGDLLATIDSPEVGEARLDLYSKLQVFDIANSEAAWEAMSYKNTLDLLDHLKRGKTPEQVHESFQNRAVGENREKLMTAYAEYRLARATIDRNRDLFAQKLITPKDFDRINASYEVAQSTYQSLMDELGYKVKLENTRAEQAKRQAETAVRAAQERLRILGVKPDGTEPPVEGGKVVGVETKGTLMEPHEGGSSEVTKLETILPKHSELALKDTPVSTYSIWAPFDGTILDREMIVPGVAVDTTHRIFTMANLDTVWVEASVHESNFEMLDRVRQRGGRIRFRSPAYLDRVFEGEVIYTGDLVEEKSRTVKLLAKAANPERLIRPGMFVEIEVLSPRTKAAMQVPTSALLSEGSESFVFVRSGASQFERRDVDATAPHGDTVIVRGGLKENDEVVVEGAYKLRALALESSSTSE